MSTSEAVALALDLESRGIRLSVAGGSLRLTPATLLSEADMREAGRHRAGLLRLAKTRCGCQRLRDEKARCWKCHSRLCSRCGHETTSAFIELCLRCEVSEQEES